MYGGKAYASMPTGAYQRRMGAGDRVLPHREHTVKPTVKDQYLGRGLSENDDGQLAVDRNLQKARHKWGMIGKILSCEGASPKGKSVECIQQMAPVASRDGCI
jgi:hypothetical protein